MIVLSYREARISKMLWAKPIIAGWPLTVARRKSGSTINLRRRKEESRSSATQPCAQSLGYGHISSRGLRSTGRCDGPLQGYNGYRPPHLANVRALTLPTVDPMPKLPQFHQTTTELSARARSSSPRQPTVPARLSSSPMVLTSSTSSSPSSEPSTCNTASAKS